MWSPYFFGASLAATELRLWSWRSTSVEICASKAALCATGRARTPADTNAVHDRLLQSMRATDRDNELKGRQLEPATYPTTPTDSTLLPTTTNPPPPALA